MFQYEIPCKKQISIKGCCEWLCLLPSKNVIILSNAKVTQMILHNFCKKQNTKRIHNSKPGPLHGLNEEQTPTIFMQNRLFNRLPCVET